MMERCAQEGRLDCRCAENHSRVVAEMILVSCYIRSRSTHIMSADSSGYTFEFGRREEDGQKGWDCAEHFNRKERRFAGMCALKMVVKRNAGK